MARELRQIVVAPLVYRLRMAGLDLSETPRVRFYPDGSLWIAEQSFCDRAMMAFGSRNGAMPHTLACVGFRALAAFGDRIYDIFYPAEYAQILMKYDELGMGVRPAAGALRAEEEQQLDCLIVMVRLYRQLSLKMAEELASALRDWWQGSGQSGVFGERGAIGISPQLHYRGKVAWFELDARGSGQETLNSLVLSILGWAIAKSYPLFLIDLATSRYEEALRAAATTVPLIE